MKAFPLFRRRLFFPVLLIVFALCLGLYFFFPAADKADYVPYRAFHGLLEQGLVERARLDGDRMYFAARPAVATTAATTAAVGVASDEQAATSATDSIGGASNSAASDSVGSTTRWPSYTENPRSPGLYEELLLQGVQVEVASDGGAIFSTILDLIFYIFFFGILIFVFRKFISPNSFKVVRRTGVSFDDVVGMDKLKAYMKQVMDIMRNPADYAARGVRAPKGVLLEGAPGNGKTLFARALAGEAKVNFIPAKATDFESMFMAIGPMKVKLLFRKARRRAPCIVFIDEFDGIGTRRNYSGSAIETENTRIVTALLNELDGFEANSGILVLAATNSIAALDPALIRPGRFDLRVQVPYPDAAARSQLVRLYLRGKRYEPDVTEEALVRLFDGASAARIESALNGAVLLAAQQGRSSFLLADVAEALRS